MNDVGDRPQLAPLPCGHEGADPTDKQLRDDLMTMLIAGHETTAAVLTWTLFALVQNPAALERALAEIDSVVGDARPGESTSPNPSPPPHHYHHPQHEQSDIAR